MNPIAEPTTESTRTLTAPALGASISTAAIAIAAVLALPSAAQAQATVTSIPGLLGGDLTDPEDDGVDAVGAGADPAANNWDFVSIAANDEADFEGGENSFNVFDNKVGGGNDKWCCNNPNPAKNITVEFDLPVSLTHFTLTSSNDSPARDPRVWQIQGSDDGITFVPIYQETDAGASQWNKLVGDARNSTLRFDLDIPSAPYKFIRYEVSATGGNQHALNEIEYFGTDVIAPGSTFIELAGDNPQIVERATPWVDPGVTNVLDENFAPLDAGELANVSVDATGLDTGVLGDYQVIYSYTAPLLSGPLWALLTEYNVGDIVQSGGIFYRCIALHVSDIGTDPGIGIDWETVWELAVQNLDSQKVRIVRVIDTAAPIVTLNGAASINVLAGTSYVDPGATAADANDAAATDVFSNLGAPKAGEATGKWTFDDDSIDDSSGNGYHGSPQGTMVYSADTPYGMPGKSIDFRGGNNAFYVDDGTPNQTVFEPIAGLRPPAVGDPTLVGQWTVESTVPGVHTVVNGGPFTADNAAIDAAVLADPVGSTSMYDSINFGGGSEGRLPGDVPGPLEGQDNITFRATGVLRINVEGDYLFGSVNDDGHSLVIENSGAHFETPLVEVGGGGRIIQALLMPAVIANSGSAGAAADFGGAPLVSDAWLEGGDSAPAFEQAGALVDPGVPGPAFSNRALLFSGEVIDSPSNPAFNVEDSDVANAINSVTLTTTPGAASELSVEFWAKPNGEGDLVCPINNLVFNGPAREGWLMYQTNEASWEWRVGDGAGYIDPVRGNAGEITYGQWVHVVGVLRLDKTDPTTPIYTSELYVDGQLANSLVQSRIPLINTFFTGGGVAGPIRMGGTNQNVELGPGRQFLGCLDEVAIYDKALSAATIQAHYENGVNAPAARTQTYPDAILADGPIGYWRGEDNQPAIDPNITGLFAPNNNGGTIGRIHLTPGDYPIKYIMREGTGGEHAEIFAKAEASPQYDPLSFGGIPGYPIDSPINISFFAKKSGWNGNNSTFVSKRGDGGMGWQVRRRNNADKVVMTTRGLGNDDPNEGSNTNVPDGAWHHVMVQYDGSGGNRKLWIDGVLDYDVTSTGLMNPAPGFNFAVGARDDNAAPGANLSRFYQGQMDQVCVFHRTLTEDERLGLVAGGNGVDTNVPGTYTVRYVSLDPSGNSGFTTRQVIVDPNPALPVITIVGDNPQTVEASADPYSDPGATVAAGPASAGDPPGTDLGAADVTGAVDRTTPGTYRLTYSYTDGTNGTALTVDRVVNVVDTTGPVLTVNGDDPLMITQGDEFIDPGATAVDSVDGMVGAFADEFPGQTLLGRWSFDDPAEPGKDDSGMGRHVTFLNGAATDDTTPPVAGRFLDCSTGDQGAIVLGGAIANDLYEAGNRDLTVATWVRGWPNNNWEPFVAKRGEGGQGWQLRRRNNETNATFTTRGIGADDDPTGAAVTQDGNWHHLAARLDRTTNEKQIFVNGVQVGSTASVNNNSVSNATNHALTFSARDNGFGSVGNWSRVALDDVQIYRAALSDAQIADLANPATGVDYFPNTPPEGNFTITYTATDAAGNTNTATRTVIVKPPLPLAITEVLQNPDNTLDITWNSRPGRIYSVEVSTDCQLWLEVTDDTESGGNTTTYKYTGDGGYPVPDPTVNPEIFLRVTELSF